jgi:hypothetical protein
LLKKTREKEKEEEAADTLEEEDIRDRISISQK